MLHFVYELIDPRTDKPFYVGITNNPNLRMLQHVTGQNDNATKNNQIAEIVAEGKQPKMHILEITEKRREALDQEAKWIQKYCSDGIQLTNIQHPSRTNCDTRRVAKVEGSKQVVKPHQGRSFEKCSETWLRMSEAFNTYGRGAHILHLAEEYGLTKQVCGTTTYYRKSELPSFRKWVSTNYPSMIFSEDS